MLNPTSLVYARINAWSEQQKLYKENGDQGLVTALSMMADITKADTTVDDVKATAAATKSTFYNKFKNGDVIYDKSNAPEGTPESNILDEATFYTEVATHLNPGLEYVEIGNPGSGYLKKKAGQILKVSIGMNAWIQAPLWKVREDGTLLVATPALCSGADIVSGLATVIVGGIVYTIPVMDPVEKSNLQIKEAWVQTIGNCTGSIEVTGSNIALMLTHQGQAAGVIFESNGEAIPTDTPIYIMNEGYVSLSTIETFAGHANSYVWYTIPYKNTPVTAEQNGNVVERIKRIVIPGYGVFDLKITAILHTPEVA